MWQINAKAYHKKNVIFKFTQLQRHSKTDIHFLNPVLVQKTTKQICPSYVWKCTYISLINIHDCTFSIREVKYTTRAQQYIQTTLSSQLYTLWQAMKRLVCSDFSFGMIDVIQVAVRNQLWEDLMEVETVLYQKHCKHSSRRLPCCWSTRMNRSGNRIDGVNHRK